MFACAASLVVSWFRVFSYASSIYGLYRGFEILGMEVPPVVNSNVGHEPSHLMEGTGS